MIVINSMSLNSVYDELTVRYTVDINSDPLTLAMNLYIGEAYLSNNKIVLNPAIIDAAQFPSIVAIIPIEAVSNFFLPEGDPEIVGSDGYDKQIFDGIFVVNPTVILIGELDQVEGAIINPYSVNLTMAHMILAIDSADKFNEVNLLFLLISASVVYIEKAMIEKGLGAYTRAAAICESEPAEFLDADVTPVGTGTGGWVVNGVYVKR